MHTTLKLSESCSNSLNSSVDGSFDCPNRRSRIKCWELSGGCFGTATVNCAFWWAHSLSLAHCCVCRCKRAAEGQPRALNDSKILLLVELFILVTNAHNLRASLWVHEHVDRDIHILEITLKSHEENVMFKLSCNLRCTVFCVVVKCSKSHGGV